MNWIKARKLVRNLVELMQEYANSFVAKSFNHWHSITN